MRRILTICAFVAVFSALALAENYTGRLVDANCYDQQKSATSCDPTSSTSAFAIIASGKALKLDDAGNTKAAEALKNRADRATPGSTTPSTQVSAKITGTMDGEKLKVEDIQVQ